MTPKSPYPIATWRDVTEGVASVERIVLGQVLIDGERAQQLIVPLQPEDFFTRERKALAAGIKAALAARERPDPIRVIQFARSVDDVDEDMLRAEAFECMDHTYPGCVLLPSDTAFVLRCSSIRQLKMANLDVGDMLEDSIPVDIVEKAKQRIDRIAAEQSAASEAAARSWSRIIGDTLESSFQGKSAKLKTGVAAIDFAMGGLEPGSLTVVGARPGGGKTTFCCHVAREYAGLPGASVGIISVADMEAEEIARILIAQECNIDHADFVAGRLDPSIMKTKQHRFLELDRKSIHVRSVPKITLDETLSMMSTLVDREGCNMLVVDYLQNIQGRPYQKGFEQIEEIARELKGFAQARGVLVIAAAQVNREAEGKGEKDDPPKMKHLRGSGGIEQNANNVLLLHNEKHDDGSQATTVFIRKNRSGETGTYHYQVDAKTRRYIETRS